MKRLIDGNALFNDLADYWGIPKDWDGQIEQLCEDALSAIENAPEVDAAEVVHGRWLYVIKGQQTSVYACSECNRAVAVVCDEEKIEDHLMKNYPYCHCGARMDGESQ